MAVTIPQPEPQERCLTFYGISWSQLQAIKAAFENVAGARFSYLDGCLEIRTNSSEREELKSTIALLIEAYMRQKGIRFYVRGGPTLGSEEQNAKKEPDESYNLETKKAIPDLVIEVVFTSGGINKLELYKRIGVPEVWFWQDGLIKLYRLRQDYEQIESSELLPDLDIALLSQYTLYADQYDAVVEFTKEVR